MEIITYEIPQMVCVRKYEVDCKSLCDLLRKRKVSVGISNKQIAEKLGIPITKVEHWFRRDSSFAVPDEFVWKELKKILCITEDRFDESILTFEEKENAYEKGNRVYDSNGICPTIMCEQSALTILDRSNRMEKKLGNIYGYTGGNYSGNVYDKNFDCPTLNTMQGGCKQPMVLENVKQLGFIDNGTGKHQSNTVYDTNAVCPNITTVQGGGTQQIKIETQYKIRKITPLECWRLMNFSDEDFRKAEAVNSNTQLYKQAGNSIVKNCLVAIFGQMIEGKEDFYKEVIK